MKQKIITIIIACSLFVAIGGGSMLLHGGIRPIRDLTRNVSNGGGWNSEQDNAKDDGRNESDEHGENDGVGNEKAKDGSEAKNGVESNGRNNGDAENYGSVKNSNESKNSGKANNDSGGDTISSVRTMRGNRKDGMNEIGFTLYKEAFVLSENGITDGERLVKTILSNGWKIEDSDILPVMNARGTIYGTVMKSGQGKQEIVFKPDEEVRREDTIILIVDTGSVPGYKKDYYDYPICGIQICSYRDEFPEVYCNGWEAWMDSDESCAVLGTTNLITSENNADYDELLYVQHPATYKESGTGNTVRLIFYSDKNTIGEKKILFSIKTEE